MVRYLVFVMFKIHILSKIYVNELCTNCKQLTTKLTNIKLIFILFILISNILYRELLSIRGFKYIHKILVT